MPTSLARARVGEDVNRHRAETERVVEHPIGQQSGVRSDPRSAKLKRQPAVEIQAKSLATQFTRPVRRSRLNWISITC